MNFLTTLNLNKNQITNVVLHSLSSDPAGVEGQIYYRQTDNVIRYHNGSTFVSLDSGGISTFTVAGDTGSFSMTDGDTLTIAGNSAGIDTSVSGSTINIQLADITNAELQNSEITLNNTDGHLSFSNSGNVALGNSITINTVNLVDTNSAQTITGNKTFSGNEVISGN